MDEFKTNFQATASGEPPNETLADTVRKASEKSAKSKPAPPSTASDVIQLIPLDKLKPFQNHAFKLYEGDKKERMKESIKEHGVIQPITVRSIKGTDFFEIISGHNRAKATEELKLAVIPAIVKELSDAEAIAFSNEANIIQRTFKTWLHSEKANSIYQYHEVLKNPGSRTDLRLATSDGIHQKSSENYARKRTALAYGESDYTIQLYLELYRLINPLKDRLDYKQFGLSTSAARNLSFINKDAQVLIESLLAEDNTCEKYEITVGNSETLRNLLESHRNISAEEKEVLLERIGEIIKKTPASESSAPKLVKIPIAKNEYESLFGAKKPDSREVVQEVVDSIRYKRSRISDEIEKNKKN